jgi:xyloglucan-specific exo-beta-1,4-glucanase
MQPYHTYVRTDVGGVYRWDAGGARWVPLLEWLPRLKGSWFGGEAIAVHPSQ